MSATARTRSLCRPPQKQRPRPSQPLPLQTTRETMQQSWTQDVKPSPSITVPSSDGQPLRLPMRLVGSLPAGISVQHWNDAGDLSGTPTAVGNGTITHPSHQLAKANR